ncbi:hypothetical protein RB195_019377 [Necator americanus]|uniref:Mos1 transposase HTH domain-containing protein n=1 Tax=Necator americanus TaxID=51031 RepID=A0ABR1CDV5_NECAM
MCSRETSLTSIKMSVTEEQPRATIIYEWRGGTGATAAERNINSKLGEGTTTIRTVKSKTSPGRDASTLQKTLPFSMLPKRIRRSTPAVS